MAKTLWNSSYWLRSVISNLWKPLWPPLKNAAEYACNLGDKIGTIEKGRLADIIVVDGDPLKDITILQELEKIKMVMRSGKIEVNRGL